jgi:hypothetical protein
VLTVVYLLQAIPVALMRYTKLVFFKLCFLASQVIALLTALPGLNHMHDSEISAGFVEFFNRLASYVSLLTIFVSMCLFFYVKGLSIKSLTPEPIAAHQHKAD